MLKLFLKSLKKTSKKGFTFVEILVAISIVAMIAGPLIRGFFSDDKLIMETRIETEASYAAKNIIEETLFGYYASLSTNVSGSYTNEMNAFNKLLNNASSTPSSYKNYISGSISHTGTTTAGRDGGYSDSFKYAYSIVPSGKDGLGSADNETVTKYLHIYLNQVGLNHCYAVSPDGELKKVSFSTASTGNNVLISKSTDSETLYKVYINNVFIFSFTLDAEINNFNILCFSSGTAEDYKIKFSASSTTLFGSDVNGRLVNYTPSTNTGTIGFDETNGFANFSVQKIVTPATEPWNTALYDAAVSVYYKDRLITTVNSIVDVKLF